MTARYKEWTHGLYRVEHETECKSFQYAIDSLTVDKSSTFRNHYSRYSLYNIWVSEDGTQHNKTLSGISFCPFCGAKLSDYDEEKMSYNEYQRHIGRI